MFAKARSVKRAGLFTLRKMKLKIVEACAVNAQHLEAGAVVELDAANAQKLINLRRAVVVASNPEVIETRDPDVETRDPQPEPRKRRK